jgi:hypothetical protein
MKMNKMKIAALASALGLSVVAGSASAWGGPFGGPGWGNGLFDGFGDMSFHMGGSARANGYGYGAPYYGYGYPYAAYPYAAAPVAPQQQQQQQPAEK